MPKDTLPEGEKTHTYEHALGRRLLSLGLYELFGLNVTPEWLDTNIRTPKSGKPFILSLPHIHYNISHCAGMAACAFADSPVGVDVEKPRSVKEDAPVRRDHPLRVHKVKGALFVSLRQSSLKSGVE